MAQKQLAAILMECLLDRSGEQNCRPGFASTVPDFAFSVFLSSADNRQSRFEVTLFVLRAFRRS